MQTITTTSHIFEYKGCPLHYWLSGPEDAPLVVCTHGAAMDHGIWDGIVPFIAEYARVLTWDARAHGLSRPTGAAFTIQRATEDLLALLDHVGYSEATLVGHSMGGNIAQEVVFAHPERVKALVMLDCACNTLKLSASDTFWLRVGIWLFGLSRLYPDKMLKRQSARANSIKPAVQEYLYRVFCQMSKQEFLTVFLATFGCLHDEVGYQITKPLLLLVGDHDTMGNIKRTAPVWARRESHCQYHMIPDAGHVSNLDNPKTVNQFVLDFLREPN